MLLGPKRAHGIGRLACKGTLWCVGQRIQPVGEFPSVRDGPYIYLFNHTSLLDTFIVIALLPEFTAAVGKKEQFNLPLWGWILKRWGVVPIDRHNLERARASMDAVESLVKAGQSLLLAPEGTRSQHGHLGPFKKGPFHIALRTSAPIVPIGILGAYKSKNKGSWTLTPGTIQVVIGDPMDPSNTTTVDALKEQTKGAFQRLLSVDAAGPSVDENQRTASPHK